MAKVIYIPRNYINRDSKTKLESFAGYSIARGLATRWVWDKDDIGDEVFDIFYCGDQDKLAVRVKRIGKSEVYFTYNSSGWLVSYGLLDHVIADFYDILVRLNYQESNASA